MQKYTITGIPRGERMKLITILDGDVSAGELLPSVIAEAGIRNETVVADMLLLGGMSLRDLSCGRERRHRIFRYRVCRRNVRARPHR